MLECVTTSAFPPDMTGIGQESAYAEYAGVMIAR